MTRLCHNKRPYRLHQLTNIQYLAGLPNDLSFKAIPSSYYSKQIKNFIMKTKVTNNYGWERPDLMHKNSVMWHSRLSFILKELQFLNSLLNENVFPIVESHTEIQAESLKEKLVNLKIEVMSLLTKVTNHKNGLKILFHETEQFEEEWDYKHQHRKLMIKVHEFDSTYQNTKKEIFRLVTQAIKHNKQKRISAQ